MLRSLHRIDPASGVVVGGPFGVRTAMLAIGLALGGAALIAFLDEPPVEPSSDESGYLMPVELREPVDGVRYAPPPPCMFRP